MFGKVQETPQTEAPHFTQEAHTVWLKLTLTGLLSTTERVTVFTLVEGFF